MVMILIIILIACGLLGKTMEKSWVNLLTFFSLMWAVIVFSASLELYGMNSVSWRPYVLIGLGVISFTVGYSIFYHHPFRFSFGHNKKHNCTDYIFRNRLFSILIIVTFFVWLILACRTLQLLYTGVSYSYIRDIYGGLNEKYSLIQNRYIDTIIKLFFVPSVYIIMVKTIYSFFSKKFKWYVYAISIVLLITYCLSTGSRQILFILMIQLMFMLFLKHNNHRIFNISKKMKTRIAILIYVAIIGIIAITVNRPTRSQNIVWTHNMSYYAYCSLPVPMADYWMSVIDYEKFRSHGVAFFRGVLSLLSRLPIPFPSEYYNISDIISTCANTYVPMFGTKTYNAFLSVFFYFYMDFGYIGVIVFSAIYGIITASIYRNFKIYTNEFTSVLFLIFIISIIKSFARWEFAQADYIMMFILLRLLYKKDYSNNY